MPARRLPVLVVLVAVAVAGLLQAPPATLLRWLTEAQLLPGRSTTTASTFDVDGRLWSTRDIGAVAASGSLVFEDGTFSVRGSGADIWGTSDELFYASVGVTGDFELSARVASIQPVNAWAKSGLMMRTGFAADAAHASVLATPSTAKGIAFQRRVIAGGASVNTSGPAAAPPVWIKLARTGATVTAYSRPSETARWSAIGAQTFPSLPDEVHVGLAMSSHVVGQVAAGVFDHVRVVQGGVAVSPGAPSLTARGKDTVTVADRIAWKDSDIGDVAVAGHATLEVNNATVTGSGGDVWGTADELHFTYRPMSGDFDITARVSSVQNVNAWTKAGVMIREHLDAGARHVSLFATPTAFKGVAFQRRLTANGMSTHTPGPAQAPPAWLKLTRTGDRVAAYYRDADTDAWTHVGDETLSGLADIVDVGLAVSSHADGVLATATFTDVAIAPRPHSIFAPRSSSNSRSTER